MNALLFNLLLHPLMQRETSEILLSHGSKQAWQVLVRVKVRLAPRYSASSRGTEAGRTRSALVPGLAPPPPPSDIFTLSCSSSLALLYPHTRCAAA